MRDVHEELVRLRRAGIRCALATVVRTAGSTPRKSAAKMLVLDGGALVGTVGGGRIEKEVVDAAIEVLREGRPRLVRAHLGHDLGMCCGGEMEVFVEPIVPVSRLLLFGSGHVAQAIAPVARRCGFEVVVVDEVDELTDPAHFPDAARFGDSFDPRDWTDLGLDGDAYCVIVTRDHPTDQALLEALLPRADQLAYLGMIGSRAKIERFRRRLEARGAYSPERWARLHAPIGLDIGAETPAEIAVAIVAELIQARAAAGGAAAPR